MTINYKPNDIYYCSEGRIEKIGDTPQPEPEPEYQRQKKSELVIEADKK